MEKLVVKKRSNQEIACWKVETEGICPNTVVESDAGLTLLVNVEGMNKVSAKRSFIMNSIVNPGKNAKLIGGKKPYTDCEIFAIDMSTEFVSEWGLGGAHAIPCFDAEFDVDAKAVCFGEFSYKIDDYFSFVRALPIGEKGEITRADVREYLRAETTNVVKGYITGKLAGRDIRECQAKLGNYSEEIKSILNDHFQTKGMTVQTFGMTKLDYEPAHLAHREDLKKAKIDVTIKGVVNEGRRDDISVERERSQIDIDLIRAQRGAAPSTEDKKPQQKVFCSRCGEANAASDNYCCRCGEKLHK